MLKPTPLATDIPMPVVVNLSELPCLSVVACVTSSVLIVATPDTFTSSSSVVPSTSSVPEISTLLLTSTSELNVATPVTVKSSS